MTRFGFKEITSKNLQEPDSISTAMLTNNDWLCEMLKPRLVESTPQDVQKLFEVSRGAMIYGYYFYPLYTLAAEQLFRVVETAVTRKCEELGFSKKKYFKNKIDTLVKENIIPQKESKQWHAIRDLRNIASHPKSQSIIPPGNAIGMLKNIAKKINFLFSATYR
jgi:hypothetical protein